MSQSAERLDVSRLAPELDRFVRQMLAPAASEEQTVLQHGRLVLTRLRDVPADESLSAEDADGEQGGDIGWRAVRLRDDSGVEEITCWRGRDGEALVHGRWDGATLELIHLQLGEHFWEARRTPRGESRFSSDPSATDAMAERRLSDLERRMREERERWDEATAFQRWRCERCRWENEGEDVTCKICGAPATGAPAGAKDEAHDGAWEERRGKSGSVASGGKLTHTIELPEGLEDVLGELVEVAEKVLHRRETSVPPERADHTAHGFDVILRSFDEAKKVSLVRAVRDARDATGDPASGLAEAKQAIDHLPAVICRGISAAGAEEIRQLLEQAGANVEVRPKPVTGETWR